MKPKFKDINSVVDAVIQGAKKATKYLTPSLVIKATFQGKRYKGAGRSTVLVTVGKPNYAERQFIKLAKKAGEPFPVKKIQLRFASA